MRPAAYSGRSTSRWPPLSRTAERRTSEPHPPHSRRDEHRAAHRILRADAYVFCAAELQGEQTNSSPGSTARRLPQRGERVALRPPSGEVHVFDAVIGERLGG